MTHVQFFDASQMAIIATFAGPQDPTAYPNQGVVDEGDERLVAFAQPQASVAGRIAALLREVDAHLDAGAAIRRYDSIATASLRAGYPGPFHDEGVAYATWMDATYARCYEILAQWEAGEIAEPTAAELIDMLPLLGLP